MEIKDLEKLIQDIVKDRVKYGIGMGKNNGKINTFYSEYDFGYCLANALKENFEVFLEFPVNLYDLCLKSSLPCRVQPIDIVVKEDENFYPIELKYSFYNNGVEYAYGTRIDDIVPQGLEYDKKKINSIFVEDSKSVVGVGYSILLTNAPNIDRAKLKEMNYTEMSLEGDKLKCFICEVSVTKQ